MEVAKIMSSRKDKEGIVIVMKASYDEVLQLGGHMENIRLFSENQVKTQTNISQRGKGSRTKYFLIPKQMRKNFAFNNKVSCHRIDSENRSMFVFVVDKTSKEASRRALVMEKYDYLEAV